LPSVSIDRECHAQVALRERPRTSAAPCASATSTVRSRSATYRRTRGPASRDGARPAAMKWPMTWPVAPANANPSARRSTNRPAARR